MQHVAILRNSSAKERINYLWPLPYALYILPHPKPHSPYISLSLVVAHSHIFMIYESDATHCINNRAYAMHTYIYIYMVGIENDE